MIVLAWLRSRVYKLLLVDSCRSRAMAKQLHALLLVVLASFAGEAFSYRFLKDFRLVRKEDALPVKDASGYGTPYVPCSK